MGILSTFLLTSLGLSLDVQELLESQKTSLQKHSSFGVPGFSDEERTRLGQGETVWRQEDTEDGKRLVVISGVVRAEPAAIWIAILDDAHNGLSERITEHQLKGSKPGHKFLYQHLSLPFPMSDRHWVLEIQTDTQTYASSAKRIWRRSWDLDARGEALLDQLDAKEKTLVKEGVWTPENRGEWLILPQQGVSLVIYRGVLDIGGKIPVSISQAVSSQSALDLFNQLQDLASNVPAHYDAAHKPILGPSGKMIKPW